LRAHKRGVHQQTGKKQRKKVEFHVWFKFGGAIKTKAEKLESLFAA
jgi:hypothetical protein